MFVRDLKYLPPLSHSLLLCLSQAPMIDPSRLENVLPACLYSPTYVVKDFPIARYQGLQFVSDLSITIPLGHKTPATEFV